MLNFKIAMWRLTILVITILLPAMAVQAQGDTSTESGTLDIISPDSGAALQGTVLVLIETNLGDPTNVSLSFTYQADLRETWFLLQDFQEVTNQELSFEWDTTTITDGDYSIRVSAETEQGMQAAYMDGLRVRNYTVIETSTPVPTDTPAPEDPTATPTRTSTTLPPTPTPLPPNPALITSNDVWNSILVGALLALGIVAVLGVTQVTRNRRRKS
jgi:hypothetical protein